MWCSCCYVENGRYNLKLEITTITKLGVFLLINIFFGNEHDTFSILCYLGAIMACGFGIAALKHPQNYWLGYGAVVLGVIVSIPYLILFVIVIIGLSIFLNNKNNNMGEMLEDHGNPAHPNDEQANSLVFLIVGMIILFAYLLFGLGTMLALTVKHYRICKTRSQGATVLIGTTTTPYNHAMYPEQPQPPPTSDYCENNKADVV